MAVISNDRIDIRINSSQKELIKYAAELKGFKSVSEFVVYCANTEATKIITENSKILNTIEDKKIFLNKILNPPKANSELKKAQLKYKKFIEANEFKNRKIK
jgi:uncharacterized protein (DUF1778 family)